MKIGSENARRARRQEMKVNGTDAMNTHTDEDAGTEIAGARDIADAGDAGMIGARAKGLALWIFPSALRRRFFLEAHANGESRNSFARIVKEIL
jgi:hypothetical protein